MPALFPLLSLPRPAPRRTLIAPALRLLGITATHWGVALPPVALAIAY